MTISQEINLLSHALLQSRTPSGALVLEHEDVATLMRILRRISVSVKHIENSEDCNDNGLADMAGYGQEPEGDNIIRVKFPRT